MKKMIILLVMLLSGIVANGQNTIGAIRDGFKNGCFYLVVDSDVDNYSVMFFKAIDGTETYDENGDIMIADYITDVEEENNEYDIYFNKKGNDWLKGQLAKAEKDENHYLVLFMTFEDYGLIMIDHSITDDGRVRMQFSLKK